MGIAMELGKDVNVITETFPKKEIYNLIAQFRKTADSVALNISEGSILHSNPDQKKFLGYAIGSLAKVATCLYKSKNRDYID